MSRNALLVIAKSALSTPVTASLKVTVKCTLDRAESTRVHVKRHPMTIRLRLGCDRSGKLVGLIADIVADTGAYASLGGPVLHRAVTHAGGPYRYQDIRVSGIAVHTNNPPAGAFRGFGVPQVTFALETALDLLAARAGVSAWEIRFRNAVRPGDRLPNGQVTMRAVAVPTRFETRSTSVIGSGIGSGSGSGAGISVISGP